MLKFYAKLNNKGDKMRAFLLLLCFTLSLHALKVNDKDISADSEDPIRIEEYKESTISFDQNALWQGIFSIKNTSEHLVNFDFNGPKQESDKYHLIYAFIDETDSVMALNGYEDMNPAKAAKTFSFYGACPLNKNKSNALHFYEKNWSDVEYTNRKISPRSFESPSVSVRLAPKSEKYLFLAYQDCSTGKLLLWDERAINEVSKNISDQTTTINNVYPLLASTSNPSTDTAFLSGGTYYFRANKVLNAVIINKETKRELKELKKTDCKGVEKIELKFYNNNEEKETCYDVFSGNSLQIYNMQTGSTTDFSGCIENPDQVKKVNDFKYKTEEIDGKTYIEFTVPNDEKTFHRKMFLEVTCTNDKMATEVLLSQKDKAKKDIKNIIRYYFDARPAKLVMTPEIDREHDKLDVGGWNADDLYAEYEYPVGHSIEANDKPLAHLADIKKNDMMSINLRKKGGEGETATYDTTHEDSKEYNKNIKITAVDGKGKKIENYTSLVDVWIVNALYHKDKEAEPSCVGFNDTCTSNFINMKAGENNEGGIYTHLVKGKKYLRYNNVGPTQIYARDQEWSYFSINHGGEDMACVLHSTSNDESKDPEGKGRIGCNVGLVAANSIVTTKEPDGKGVDFYYFKPAVFKLKVDIANSPANSSYGSKYYTYMHSINEKAKSSTNLGGISTITNEETEDKTLDIFESASIDSTILAIGASEESFKNEKTLSDYDADLQIAEYVEFENLGPNPKLSYKYPKTQEKGDIVDDMPLYILANQDLASAIMIDVSEGVLSKAEKISKAEQAEKFKAVTITEDDGTTSTIDAMRIDKDWTNFSGGRNTSKYKLNFDRNDLIAKSFVRVDINTTKLNDDIFENEDDKPEEWQRLARQNISVAGRFKGEDLMFIDPAIIAPDFSSNASKDAAVFLAAYCEKDCDKYFGARVPNHIRYYALPLNVITDNNNTAGGSTSASESLFSYKGAGFTKYLKGSDYIASTTGAGRASVTLTLKGSGDEPKNYCSLFRNCGPLDGGGYGVKFDVFFSGDSKWTGGGDDQGDTIVGDKDSTQKRRKAPRMSF